MCLDFPELKDDDAFKAEYEEEKIAMLFKKDPLEALNEINNYNI